MEELDKIILDDNLFFINGAKYFIKDYEDNYENSYLKESVYIKKVYESKRNTLRFIRDKRKEYKEKILSIENKINLLRNTLRELELERELRINKIKDYNQLDSKLKENIEDITDAIIENKKIISLEEDKVKKMNLDYKNFNETSLEEENKVFIFLKYIKREFIKIRMKIIEVLNNDNLNEIDFILTYEYLLIITKNMICVEEDLIGE